MRVEIENGKLANAIGFLYGLNLTRKLSRMRRHLIDKMDDRLKQVEKDRKELLKEHSNKDENGEAIIREDGNYDVIDMGAFADDLGELYSEKLVLEGGDNREMIRSIKIALKKFEDEEYGGQDSEVYDYLCDQFKVDENEEEK